jgi:ABC transport system ATP-binding/permease protein
MNDRLVSPPDAPVLVVKTQGSDQTLRAGSQYRVGRDPQSDIVINDSRVSWRHAVLRADHDAWILEDSGSTNGTFLGTRRIGKIEISQNCILRLGHPDDGPVMMCSVNRPGAVNTAPKTGMSSVDRRPTSVRRAPTRLLRIGRAPENDLVVPDLSVSRVHAELRNLGDGRYEIADLGSHNGTFVNGQRITRATTVTEQDLIGIGRATFRLFGDELREFIDEGDVTFVAQDLTVRLPGGKVLLDHVSFPIPERSLVGVIGPSGAGKSTLLGALTGTRPATEGAVLYDNRDLYTHYAELRHRIGLVPQDNILHDQLKPKRALRYAAELRFPGDTSRSERDRRVDEVIDELALTAHCGTRTGAMSGGQQKRVNVALELLTKPSLLFLDEPTSGLDPGLDKSVMELMSGLAKDGRTVIIVTHSVANLGVCDRLLVLVPGGRVAFYGPPAEGLRYFGKTDWAEVFQAFDAEPDRDWTGDFRRSPYYAEHVAGGLAQQIPEADRQSPGRPPAPRGALAQISTLCRRYIAVIASDRSYLALLAIMPIVIGLLLRAVPSPEGLAGRPGSNSGAGTVLLVLIIGACFIGAANSVRELVKERSIYARERAAGLSSGTYLVSKIIVLGVISGLQGLLLVALGLAGRQMPAHGSLIKPFPLLEIAVAIVVLSVASMALGLLVSSIVSTSEKAMPLLVLLAIAQVILSGGVVPLNGKVGLNQLSWLTPARWGFASTASTVKLNVISPPASGLPDPVWEHKPGVWLLDIGLMVVLSLVFTVVTWRRLVGLSPGRKRR